MLSSMEKNNSTVTPDNQAADAHKTVPLRVVLISRTGETWSAWLPAKPEGHYRFQDVNGIDAELPFYIEATDHRWVAYCGHSATFRREADQILGHEVALSDKMLVRIYAGFQRYFLYAEFERPGDNTFLPYFFEERAEYLIGRMDDCDICYPNITVSRNHAKLRWKSGSWYSYQGSKLAQGRDATKKLLADNPELCEELETQIKQAISDKANA